MKLIFLLVAVVLAFRGADARTCVCAATWGGGEVNVRSCASTTCSVLGTMQVGICATFQAMADSVWQRITFNGQTGYVHSDYTAGPQECGGGGTGYCVANLCASYSSNQRRFCDAYGCGNYGASRGTREHGGWDVRCQPAGAVVYAPFAGTVVSKAYPYGDGTCCDTGFRITGSGQFSGHDVMIFYCDPNRITIPSTVTKGQAVATHRSLHCSGCYATTMTDHIHYQVSYNGVRIDPASWLFYCT